MSNMNAYLKFIKENNSRFLGVGSRLNESSDREYHVAEVSDSGQKTVSVHKSLNDAKAAHDKVGGTDKTHAIWEVSKKTRGKADGMKHDGWHETHNVHFKSNGKWENEKDAHDMDDDDGHEEYHPKHGVNTGDWASAARSAPTTVVASATKRSSKMSCPTPCGNSAATSSIARTAGSDSIT